MSHAATIKEAELCHHAAMIKEAELCHHAAMIKEAEGQCHTINACVLQQTHRESMLALEHEATAEK